IEMVALAMHRHCDAWLDPLIHIAQFLTDMGVNVIHEHDSDALIHASGHPAREELRDMYQWIKPSIAVPVHGESHHLDAHAALTKQIGVPTTLNGRNGDLYMLAPQPGLRRRAATVGRLVLKR
ncbi:MAG: MBL fold metallo-hydrolase RNA specificity domain-containing protein, partial [Pseudomonadota bacterium]